MLLSFLFAIMTCARARVCSFDYGNAETNNNDDGAGTMECVYFGSWNATRNGGWCGGSGPGPWVMAGMSYVWISAPPYSLSLSFSLSLFLSHTRALSHTHSLS
eukprot:COSAG05_NODE_5136_length_1255_cov_2.293253_2_plen_102_part_01